MNTENVVESGTAYEQQTVLQHEEREWHKSARKRLEGEGERVWLEGVVLDPRVAGRMRRFELAGGEEERARRIEEGREGGLGQEVGVVGGEEGMVWRGLAMLGLGGGAREGVRPGWVQGEEGEDEGAA